jgi:response regulator RpfG family c-di-GMP phosphodiesterase
MKERAQVLVVDDEPFIVESLVNLLEFEYEVLTAYNGQDAIALLKKNPVKVIMSDQRMPSMFGHELLREAKKIKPNTIRILLTGYSDLESIMYSVNAGEIFRYINKPWKSDMILKVFQLGVQLHDRLLDLSKQKNYEDRFGKTADDDAIPKRSVHIEVEEKNGSVMFVGYREGEIKNLVGQLQNKFTIVNAASYDAALQEIAKKPISVIVSDVQFEGMDFLTTIKEEFPHIVTVVLSEVIDANLAIRSINELNVFKYLTSPVEGAAFEQVLTEATYKNKQYKAAPQTNLLYTANTITPPAEPQAGVQESVYRLKLRALQASLAKKNNQ